MFKVVTMYKTRAILIGERVTVRASRWPWQIKHGGGLLSDPKNTGKRYGWHHKDPMGRFGGGWKWELGINIGGCSIILNLLFGLITISWYKDQKWEERR